MSAEQIAAFRAANDPSTLPPPSPLPQLSRSAVLEAQRALRAQEEALDQAGEQRTRRVLVGPGKAWTNKTLEELEDVGLDREGGLMMDSRGVGKVLVLRVISQPVKTAAVHIVLEDRKGRVAPVQLFNLPSRWTREELSASYPLGSCWALKEPVIRSSSKGFLIRVDSPTDLVRLLPSHALLLTPFQTPPPAPVSQLSALEHKNKGNTLFTSGQLIPALEQYTLALDLLAHTATPDHTLQAVLLSNRAATLLKLNRPGAALRDTHVALALPGLTEASRVKLLYRAASAQYALEDWDACEDSLDSLFKLAKEDPTALELYWRLSRRVHESQSGRYDWVAMYEDSRAEPRLNVASYANLALRVENLRGKHRALVATQVLDPGELLFVQKPLAVGRGDEERKSVVMGVNLFSDTLAPYAMGEVVSGLVERWEDEPERRAEIGRLWAGEEMAFVEGGAEGEAVDISRLEAIATFNSFHLSPLTAQEDPAPSTQEDDKNAHISAALYSLPSYMNHACLGNVSYSFLGDIIFARARTRIEKGEELVDSYINALDDLETRRGNLAKHGFVCGCALCVVDEADGEEPRRRRRVLQVEVDEIQESIHSQKEGDAVDPAQYIPRLKELVSDIDGTHALSRGPLRPATYSARRLLAQSLADSGQRIEAIQAEIGALQALGAVFAPTTAEDVAHPERVELKQVPQLGDSNAVLSCLFIAQQCGELDRDEAEGEWVEIARRIERGQAGEELFHLRYAKWAERHYLDLGI